MTCRERHRLTPGAIESVVQNTRMPFRFVYADVCSPEWVRAKIAEHAKAWRLEVLRFDEPLWPTQVRRRIVSQIGSKYAVFIDNDVIVSPNWLENLVACAEKTGAGIVGPLYLWGESGLADRIHMAGGELKEERQPAGIVLREEHRYFNMKVDELELRRQECDFVEFHCMLMRREVFRAPDIFDERIVCVHEHIHASLVARAMGYKTYCDPTARVTYLVVAPYSLADLPVFRRRWSFEACESSIQSFARRWGVIDDERSFGVRQYIARHRCDVDPVRSSLQSGSISRTPMQASDLRQSLSGLIELAESRGYTADDIAQIRKAHWSALLLSSGGYRPCGRPFIDHLVGTASALVHYGCETRLVLAGLLHAAYSHAPHVPGGSLETVETIERWLGGRDSPIERAVRSYTVRMGRWQELSSLDNWQDIATMSDIDTAMLAMANGADMYLSGEVRATGRTDVDDCAVLPKAREICEIVGVPGLAEIHTLHQVRADQFAPNENRPVASFRVEGKKVVSMVNPAFFEVQQTALQTQSSVENL